MFIKLALQLFALLAVSILSGFIFTSLKSNFIIGFFSGAVLQVFGFYLYSNIINLYVAIKSKKLEVLKLREMSYQSVEVICPCFKQIRDFVPFRFNTANYYKCRECTKTISIHTTTETAVVTEPILSANVDPILIEKLKDATT
jgi:hypothetical protein